MTRYLLADIGGTHTRVAFAEPGGAPYEVARYRNDQLAGPVEALRLKRRQAQAPVGTPWVVAAAVAGPVQAGRVRLTNLGWELEAASLAQEVGADEAVLVNDYQALARSIPELSEQACTPIGGGLDGDGRTYAVLGPGTGLGVSGVVPARSGWAVIAGEGGHVTLAATDEAEAELVSSLRAELGHVSAETVLSGPGLQRLHRLLHSVDESPERLVAALYAGDPTAEETLRRFCGFLGEVAGDVALTLGARGGTYLAGGILPRLDVEWLRRSGLHARFLAKGRFSDYLAKVPLKRIDDPDYAALLGLRAWLDDLRYPVAAD